MGLDIYAGPLTRYFSGDWMTVVQRMAAEQGLEVVTVRPGEGPQAAAGGGGVFGRLLRKLGLKSDPPPGEDEADPAAVQQLVVAWRDQLLQALTDSGIDAQPWNESREADYETDKPAWDNYGHLLLWAAYAECTDLEPPGEAVERWHDDPALQRVQSTEHTTAYPSLLKGAEVWLPLDFGGGFETSLPNERRVTFGSLPRLRAELAALNDATWRADDAVVTKWRGGEGVELHAPFAAKAQFGFSVVDALSRFAHDRRVPMLLDY